jgi:hypothetical protein
LVFGAGNTNAVGICTFGKVVGIADEVILLPGMMWYCTILATDAAGRALITAREIPERVNAASSGANTVNTVFLSETAGIKPALVTAALRMEKFGVFKTSPIELIVPGGYAIGVASSTFLLQDVATKTTSVNTGNQFLIMFNLFFMFIFLVCFCVDLD